MTTVIVDVNAAKVYSDTLITRTTSTWNKSIMGRETKSKEWVHILCGDPEYKKIIEKDNLIIAGCGDMDTLNAFAENYPHDLPDPTGLSKILVITKMHNSLTYFKFVTTEDKKRRWKPWIKNKLVWKVTSHTALNGWIVMGSGEEYAWGALLAGATPSEAIKIASMKDVGTGCIVDSATIPKIA